MKTEFVVYEHALALKDLGFDEECFGTYFSHGNSKNLPVLQCDFPSSIQDNKTSRCEVSAPLYQQSFRWFREKYDLWAWITPVHIDDENREMYFEILNENGVDKSLLSAYNSFGDVDLCTYEEAELACLNKLIEIIKEREDV